MEAQKKLTLEGNIVISVGLFGHSGNQEVWENMDEGTLTKTKEMLDDMHKRKIDMADGTLDRICFFLYLGHFNMRDGMT